MNRKKWIIIGSVILAAILILTIVLVACCNKSDKKISNETTPLVLSSEALDGVFNPFFYTAGADGEIVGVTQISMLSSDSNGMIAVGEDEPSVVLDYNYKTTGSEKDPNEQGDAAYKDYYTTYQFVIKNDIKFSDGQPLTMDDVLFNLYMYLDPAYTGSTTMYSVGIKGLQAYRTQTENVDEQENFEQIFAVAAQSRITSIQSWANGNTPATEQIKKDLATVRALFKEELETDWTSAQSAMENYKDTFQFSEGWQIFFYQYGYITVKGATADETPDNINWNGIDGMTNLHSKDNAVAYVLENMLGNDELALEDFSDKQKDNVYSIVTYYQTANNALEQFKAEEKTEYYQRPENKPNIRSISGITTKTLKAGESFTRTKIETVIENGKEKLVYEQEETSYAEDMEVLQIVINGVDPKAIWNFGFTVAPKHYYSPDALATAEAAAKAEGKEIVVNYGVAFSNFDFMTAVKANQMPVGAGPYKMSDRNGSETVNAKSSFFDGSIAYFVRNEHFLLGAPKIRLLRYKVIATNQIENAVITGEVHYAQTGATTEVENNLQNVEKLKVEKLPNLGYGYIGINASFVNELGVRRAIMTAMNIEDVRAYYSAGMAELIYRPMSKLSWAYPEGATSYYYKDYAEEVQDLPVEQREAAAKELRAAEIRDLVEGEGYKLVNGKYTKMKNGKQTPLKFTFTVAGETNDHPVYMIFKNASEFLNELGFDITVTHDSQALVKLANGNLEVWGAAWSSTIDPDMFQVYHEDSTATSIRAWGYPYLLSKGTAEEQNIIHDLSLQIELARQTTDQNLRTEIYADALDLVMELAVEIPVYQRSNLFAYDKTIIDETTLNPNASAYEGLLSRIWEVSLKETA